jgi:hypothetical protein
MRTTTKATADPYGMTTKEQATAKTLWMFECDAPPFRKERERVGDPIYGGGAEKNR